MKGLGCIKTFILFMVLSVMISSISGCQKNEKTKITDSLNTKMEEEKNMITFGSNATEKMGAISTKGTSEMKAIKTDVGDYQTSYPCRTLTGTGSELSFTINEIKSGEVLTMEVEEIHLRTDKRIAYTIYINDKKSYYRTYIPCSDGPNHYFFEVPSDIVKGKNNIRVRIVSNTDQEIRFERIWAFSDLKTTLNEEKVYKKMPVVLMFNEVPNNIDVDSIKKLIESYQCDDMYEIGLCWEIQYMQWGKEKTETYLNNVISASAATGAPLYLGIDSWWSGTPSGPDGEGGLWQDFIYNQVTYDPLNQDGRGTWKFTTPNVWGNTPWLSMNNNTYNKARVSRIKETVNYIKNISAKFAINGKELPAIHVYTENEPIYWPINWTKYDFLETPGGVGDFSPLVMADAKKDGVTLDPTDGLSDKEALWMFKNLHKYISEVGSAIADGYQYNTVTVKKGVVTLPDDQLVENSFTHMTIGSMYPNWDNQRCLWEAHMLSSIHYGGEWNTNLPATANQTHGDKRALDYIIARGSYADINCERGGMTNFNVLPQAYEYGMEGLVVYNFIANGDGKLIKEQSKYKSQKATPSHYAINSLVSGNFSIETSMQLSDTLVAIDGVNWDGMNIEPQNNNGGKLTYKITDSSSIKQGLMVILKGAIQNSGASVEIWSGSSVNNLKLVQKLTEVTDNTRVNVPYNMINNEKEAYIQIRLKAQNQMSDLSLSSISITASEDVTGSSNSHCYTLEEMRTLNLYMMYRADTERLLEKYLDRSGKDDLYIQAYNLYQEHKYVSAYHKIASAISETLPAEYLVSGYGQLGKYPISLKIGKSDAKVTVTLLKASSDEYTFNLSTTKETNITIDLSLETAQKYSLTQQKNGNWTIKKDNKGKKANSGKFTFSVDLKPDTNLYPTEFEARAISSDSSTLTFITHDKRVNDYSNGISITYSNDVEIFTGGDGFSDSDMKKGTTADVQYGDYLKITLDDSQNVKKVYSYRGEITGTVTKVQQASAVNNVTNPFVTIKDTNGVEHTFEIGSECKLLYSKSTGKQTLLTVIGNIGIEPGDTLNIRYSPYVVNNRSKRALLIKDA